MSKIRLSAENFLNRFSYTKKTQFVCFLGIFYAIFLTTELYFAQHDLIKMYEMKLVGIQQHRDLCKLLEENSELQLLLFERKSRHLDEEKIETLTKTIDANLKKINSFMLIDTSSAYFLQSEKMRDSNLLLDKTTRQWESIEIARRKYKNLSIVTFAEFSHNILDLIDQNMQSHFLTVGVKMTILLLSDVAISKLPDIQNILTNIATLQMKVQQGLTEENTQVEYLDLLGPLQNKVKSMETQISYVIKENQLGGEKKSFSEMIDLLQTFAKTVGDFPKDFKEFNAQLKVSDPFSEDLLAKGWIIEDSIVEFLEKDIKVALNTLYSKEIISKAIIIFALLAFFVMYVTRVMQRPLEELKNAAKALAEGNLSIRVPVTSNDEVSTIIKAFNSMAEVWEESIIKAKNVTERLVRTSISIFDIVKSLEENVSIQEASMEAMKIQAQEIEFTTYKFNKILKEVSESIVVSSNFAETGRFNLLEMENITEQMKEASGIVMDTLALIENQVEKTNGVLGTVIAIADQSNLLSLNTAIRASQTGIKGAGFAVVAGKIRELADRTAFAALDIEEIVQDIVQAVTSAFSDVSRFSSQVLDQVSDEKNISDLLKTRIDQSQQQIKTFENIQKDMDLQLKESLQIGTLIHDLIQVTTETGKSAHMLKQDADYLYQGSQNLQETINRFHFRQ